MNYKSNDKSCNVNGKVKFSEKELSVLSALQESDDLTNQQLIARLGIPQRTISRILSKINNNGLIERIGSDKSGQWKVK